MHKTISWYSRCCFEPKSIEKDIPHLGFDSFFQEIQLVVWCEGRDTTNYHLEMKGEIKIRVIFHVTVQVPNPNPIPSPNSRDQRHQLEARIEKYNNYVNLILSTGALPLMTIWEGST